MDNAILGDMDVNVRERLVVVPVGALDDLLELATRVLDAAGRVPENDSLLSALRGAVSEVRCRSALEP